MRRSVKIAAAVAGFVLLAAAAVFGFILFRDRGVIEHNEYMIALGGRPVYWGYYRVKTGVADEPEVRVEYIRPAEGDPVDIVFYAPLKNAENSLSRPQLYPLTADHNMLLFTVAFDYGVEQRRPPEHSYDDHRSQWFGFVLKMRDRLARDFGIPKENMLIIADSAGGKMAQELSRYYPEKVAAAAWCGSSQFVYDSPAHPPVLAMQAWGDRGISELSAAVAADRKAGGDSYFAVAAPDWTAKDTKTFHHGGGSPAFALMRDFLSDRKAFDRTWAAYPHEAINGFIERNAPGELLRFRLPGAEPEYAAVLLLPWEWCERAWPVDNLLFLAERGAAASVYVMTGNPVKDAEAVKSCLADKLPTVVVCGPDFRALDMIDWSNYPQVSAIYVLNPVELTEKYRVCGNDPKIKTLPNGIYRPEPGDDFGKYYFDVLGYLLSSSRELMAPKR